MKTLVIVATMQDAAASAFAYGPGDPHLWIAEALGLMLEGDCTDPDPNVDGKRYGDEVKRRFGFHSFQARDAFTVVLADFLKSDDPRDVERIVDTLAELESEPVADFGRRETHRTDTLTVQKEGGAE